MIKKYQEKHGCKICAYYMHNGIVVYINTQHILLNGKKITHVYCVSVKEEVFLNINTCNQITHNENSQLW